MSSETSPLYYENSKETTRSKLFRNSHRGLFVVLVLAAIYLLTCSSGGSSVDGERTVQHLTALTHEAEQHWIKTLPGLPKGKHEHQFSGYLTLANGKKLHYWFVESQNQPDSDPVVLWLNGGPGASSLGGLLNENGPFTVENDGLNLRRNPFSWNRNTNMLFFESPVGVGFSYDPSGNYTSDDFSQARENHEALLRFFDKFPTLRENEFYVTGESYGGVYVPTLAQEIMEKNNVEKDPSKTINLVGIAVGNGVNEYSTNSQLFFAYYHGLLGYDTWTDLKRKCPDLKEFAKPDFNFFNILKPNGQGNPCAKARVQAFSSMMASHINSYDIYRKCSHGDPMYGINKLIDELLPHQTKNPVSMIAQPLSIPMSLCLNTTAGTNYLNRKVVKEAMHVPSELQWGEIAMTNMSAAGLRQLNLTLDKPVLNYGMPLKGHVIPIWKRLLQNSIRVVIYHGDVDFMCDFLGGQWAVESMNLTVASEYQPWFTGKQASGFVKEFAENMTFLTIKGAGHMAPQWKPEETLQMFERYVLRIE